MMAQAPQTDFILAGPTARRAGWQNRTSRLRVCHLYISAGNNFLGRHGRPPGGHQIREVSEIECVAGRGIRGDRFFDHQKNYKGQITFFAVEIHDALCRGLAVRDKAPSVFRRKVITGGMALNVLIGREFQLQGVWFRGMEECRPCHWMDQAFAPSAEQSLQGRGGLRAVILTNGQLRVDVPCSRPRCFSPADFRAAWAWTKRRRKYPANRFGQDSCGCCGNCSRPHFGFPRAPGLSGVRRTLGW
jgi:hypothetical protein